MEPSRHSTLVRPRTLAVIGGRGWLGQAIVAAARAHADLRVTVVSRVAVDGAVAADPLDSVSLAAATAGCDVVVNAAGCKSGSPDDHSAANVQLPERLAALSAEHGWQLVHLGSAAEYGKPVTSGTQGSGRISEDQTCVPTSLYGTSKLAGTEAVLAWRDKGAPATVARVFNLVDPDLPDENPLTGIVRQVRQATSATAATTGSGTATAAAAEPRVVAIGDPTTTRDLCPRAWVAEAILALATRPADLPLVNVCSGRAISFGALAYDVAHRLGVPITVRDLGWPRGGHVVGDPTRLQKLLPAGTATQIDDPATVLVGQDDTPHPRPHQAAGEQR